MAVHPIAAPAEAAFLDLARRATLLPYTFYRGVTPEAAVRYATLAWERTLAGTGAVGFLWWEPGDAGPGDALLLYQPLSWDSRILGFPCARVAALAVTECGEDRDRPLRAARALFEAAVGRAREDGVRHLSVRLDARAVGLIQAAEAVGFATVDALLRFSFDLEAPLPKAPSPPAWVREAKPADVPALRAMAEHGFVLDRFHADRAIAPAAADQLHAEWVEAAALGRTGSGLLVAESGAGLAGFFIQGEDPLARDALGFGVGQLVLIAVDAAWRGKGIGGLLTRSSLAWHRARGNRYAEVGTQLANVPATNLYLGAGCRLVDTSVTLRWWDEAAS